MAKRSIALIGAPVDGGAGMSGCIMGPAALRVANIGGALSDLDFAVEDWGDVTPEKVNLTLGGQTHHENEVAGFARALYKNGVEAFSRGMLPIFLGGDHSLSMGTVTAAARHAAATGKKNCMCCGLMRTLILTRRIHPIQAICTACLRPSFVVSPGLTAFWSSGLTRLIPKISMYLAYGLSIKKKANCCETGASM